MMDDDHDGRCWGCVLLACMLHLGLTLAKDGCLLQQVGTAVALLCNQCVIGATPFTVGDIPLGAALNRCCTLLLFVCCSIGGSEGRSQTLLLSPHPFVYTFEVAVV